MAFDPDKPFEMEPRGFDPNQPFEAGEAPRPAESRAPRSVRQAMEPSMRMQQYTPEMYKGAASGFLGQIGDIEEFGRYSVPEFFGARPTPQAQRQTIAPTTEDVSRRLYGERPTGEAGQYRQFGEMVGGLFGLPFGAARRLATGAARVGEEALRPGRVVEQFGQAPPSVTPAREVISGTPSAPAGPRPGGTVSDVGEFIQTGAGQRLGELSRARSQAAEQAFSRYFREGEQAAGDIIQDYNKAIRELDEMRPGAITADQRAVINKSLENLRPRQTTLPDGTTTFVQPSIEAIEAERRRLRAVAQNMGEEGYSALQRRFADSLADMFESIVTSKVGSAADAIRIYREVSEPINRYGTALGKTATQEAGRYLPDVPKIDPANVPGRFFRSRSSINELKEFLGSERAAEQAARAHVGNEIRGLRTADQVRKYMSDNADWLKEVPKVDEELRGLADRLQRGQTARTLAKVAGGGALAGAGITGTSRLFGGR